MNRLKRLIHEIHRRSLWQVLLIYLGPARDPGPGMVHAKLRRQVVRWGGPLLVILASGLALACESSTAPPTEESEVELTIDFEGASLESWSEPAPGTFNLRVGNDTNSSFARWYSFKVLGGAGETLTFRIVNAGSLSAADAFTFNPPTVSADGGDTWSRISEADYDAGVFSFRHTPTSQEEWIALGPPYNFSRWVALAGEISAHPMVDSLVVITETLQGRPLHLVKITDTSVPDEEKGAVWGIGRQHPAEVGGSWMAEGLLRWLLSDDPVAQDLLRGDSGPVHCAYRGRGCRPNRGVRPVR